MGLQDRLRRLGDRARPRRGTASPRTLLLLAAAGVALSAALFLNGSGPALLAPVFGYSVAAGVCGVLALRPGAPEVDELYAPLGIGVAFVCFGLTPPLVDAAYREAPYVLVCGAFVTLGLVGVVAGLRRTAARQRGSRPAPRDLT